MAAQLTSSHLGAGGAGQGRRWGRGARLLRRPSSSAVRAGKCSSGPGGGPRLCSVWAAGVSESPLRALGTGGRHRGLGTLGRLGFAESAVTQACLLGSQAALPCCGPPGSVFTPYRACLPLVPRERPDSVWARGCETAAERALHAAPAAVKRPPAQGLEAFCAGFSFVSTYCPENGSFLSSSHRSDRDSLYNCNLQVYLINITCPKQSKAGLRVYSLLLITGCQIWD